MKLFQGKKKVFQFKNIRYKIFNKGVKLYVNNISYFK